MYLFWKHWNNIQWVVCWYISSTSLFKHFIHNVISEQDFIPGNFCFRVGCLKIESEMERVACKTFTEESLGSEKDRLEQEELICNVVASDRIQQGLGSGVLGLDWPFRFAANYYEGLGLYTLHVMALTEGLPSCGKGVEREWYSSLRPKGCVSRRLDQLKDVHGHIIFTIVCLCCIFLRWDNNSMSCHQTLYPK